MDDPRSAERMRHSALELLASGNTLQSVAHVFDVPVETVMAWRLGPAASAAAPPSAKAPPDAAPALRADAAPLTVRVELDFAGPGSMRAAGLACGMVLAVVMAWVVVSIWRTDPGSAATFASAAMVAVVGSIATITLLRLTPRTLRMGRESIVAPRLFGDVAMAYSDVAGYTLAADVLRLGDNANIRGQTLSIRSRRPGAEPLEVFIYDAHPVPPAMLARLDEVVRANHGAPALPARVGPPAAAGGATAGVWLMLVVLVAGVLQFLPGIANSWRVLRHGMPPLARLQHREGRVTAASVCYAAAGKGGTRSMKIVLDDTPGAPTLVVPCLLDYALLMDHRPHRLAVDLDPGGLPANLVYRMALDGAVVLDDDAVRAARRRDVIRPAQFQMATSLLVVALSIGLFAWTLGRRRAVAAAR